MANVIRWFLDAESGGLRREVAQAEGLLGRLDTSGKRAFGGLSSAAGLAGASIGAYGLASQIGAAVSAAREAEAVNARLKAQLDALSISWEGNRSRIEEVIESQSRLAALDDEELTDSFTTIVRVTKDVNQALELNALAADIARGRNMDLGAAAELVAKVAAGNTGILKRYAIQIEEGADATEALGQLQERFAGQAKAYGESSAGAADRAAVAWENAQEQLGQKLLPVLTRLAEFAADELIPAITNFAGTVDDVVEKIGGWKDAAIGLFAVFSAAKILSISRALRTSLIPALAETGAAAGAAAAGSAGGGGFLGAFGKVLRDPRVGIAAAIAAAFIALKSYSDEVDEHAEELGEKYGEKTEVGYRNAMKVGRAGSGLAIKKWLDSLAEEGTPAMMAAGDLGLQLGNEVVKQLASAVATGLPTVVGQALGGGAYTGGVMGSTPGSQTGLGGLGNYVNAGQGATTRLGTVIDFAMAQQGVNYAWGDEGVGGAPGSPGPATKAGEQGFDCSGLIWAAYQRIGITLPRTSQEMAKAGVEVSPSQLRPGDIIVTNYGKHAVLYIGGGKVIAASSSADKVLVQPASLHLGAGFVTARRVIQGGETVDADAVVDVVAGSAGGAASGGASGSSSASGTRSRPAVDPFAGIRGISDRFDAKLVGLDETSETLGPDGQIVKSSVRIGRNLRRLRKLRKQAREEVVRLTNRITAINKSIAYLARIRTSKNKASIDRELRELKAKRVALREERAEMVEIWERIGDTIRSLTDALAEDEENEAAEDDGGDTPPGDEDGDVVSTPVDGEFDPTPSASDESRDQHLRRLEADVNAGKFSQAFLAALGIGFSPAGNVVIDGGGGLPTGGAPGRQVYGGPVVVFQSSFPPSEQQAREAAAGVAQGLAQPGSRQSSTVLTGI